MEIGGNITSVTSRPGHTQKHITVSVTIDVEVLKSAYGDSKNIKAMGLTLGTCIIKQPVDGE